MKKKDLIRILNNVDDNTEIFIYCSNNRYAIRHSVTADDSITLFVGETDNPPEDYFSTPSRA